MTSHKHLQISNVVHTGHFWNKLHQLSSKSKQLEANMMSVLLWHHEKKLFKKSLKIPKV